MPVLRKGLHSGKAVMRGRVYTCRGAVQRKGQRKHAALAALVKSADFLMPSGNSVGPDIRSDPALMAILRQLLVSSYPAPCICCSWLKSLARPAVVVVTLIL